VDNKKNSFLARYVDFASQITDAPLEFHSFLSIATVGAVLGRSRFISFGETQLYPNFYMIILAATAFHRKSTALGISQRTLAFANPTAILPSEFSQEKIQEILEKNPQGTFYYYEFKTLMGLLSKDYMMGCKGFLTELWDCNDEYMRATKTATVCIKNPCVSMLAATTSDWFLSSIKAGDIEGGFLNRFLFVYNDKKVRDDAFPPIANKQKRFALNEMLKNIYNDNIALDGGREMLLTPAAKKLYEQFYHSFVRAYNAISYLYRNLFTRVNIYTLKIAIVLQTCYEPAEVYINENVMAEAIQHSKWLMASLKNLCEGEITFTPAEKNEKAILRIIGQHPDITRTELLRKAHLDSQTFGRVIQTLLEKEQIIFNKKKLEGSQRETMVISLKKL